MKTKTDRVAGTRIGMLTLVKEVQPNNGNRRFLFACDCGRTVERVWGSRGRSCGCMRDKQAPLNNRSSLPKGESSFNMLFSNYRWAAQNRGLAFELTKVEFRALTTSKCSYCGLTPSSVMRRGKNVPYVYNGIDRINNSVGYVVGNVETCCEQCNKAKRMMSREEFLGWVATVYAHSVVGRQT